MNTKKTVAMILSLFFRSSLVLGQQYGWVALNPASIPGTPDLADVFFITDNEGWISSSSAAEIYHTTDGGQTFTIQTTALPCEAIWMLNADTGFAGGQSGFVYKTTNGGLNWNFHGTIVNTLTGISFPSQTADTGYACGFNGAVWRINSGGVTDLNSGFGGSFSGISAPSVNNVIVCGGSSIYQYNGAAFFEQSAPTGAFSSIDFFNDLRGWVAGEVLIGGLIAATKDSANWVVLALPVDPLYGINVLDTNNVWAVGVNGALFHCANASDFGFDTTTSTGWTNTIWTQEAQGLTTEFLRNIYMTSTTNGYAVGNNKTLLKYTQLTPVEENASTNKLAVFPNPTTGIVQLQLPFPNEVDDVELFDVFDKQILKEEKTINHQLDLCALPSAVYLLKVKYREQLFFERIIKQ